MYILRIRSKPFDLNHVTDHTRGSTTLPRLLKHLTLTESTMLYAIGWRVLGGVRQFWRFAIFSLANSRYSYFGGVSWGKEEESVIGITFATGNHSGRILDGFWVSSTFWSQWSRFQSHLRSFAGDFASGKLSGPPGPFQCWSCLEAMCIHFW
jgi:hypothetical protein